MDRQMFVQCQARNKTELSDSSSVLENNAGPVSSLWNLQIIGG